MSKRVVDQQGLMQQAASLQSQLAALRSFISSTEEGTDAASIRKAVRACSRCQDVLSACKASEDPTAGKHVEDGSSAVDQLKGMLGGLAFVQISARLAEALKSLFADSLTSFPPDVETLLGHVMVAGLYPQVFPS